MIRCKNCDNLFEGKYCNQCGQKHYTDRDKSLGYLFGEAFHFLTHFEGSFLTTVKTMLTKPGQLSADYAAGIRKRYFKPVSLFLMVVVLYLFFPLFPGLNLPMSFYRDLPVTGTTISGQIEHRLTSEKVSEAKLTEKFGHTSEKVSKVFLFLLVIFSAMIISMLFRKNKRYAYDNMIAAIEINTFFILIFFILLAVLLSPLIRWAGSALTTLRTEHIFSAFILLCFAVYTSIVFKKLFCQPLWICLVKGLCFSILYSFTLMFIYRPIVFEITFVFI